VNVHASMKVWLTELARGITFCGRRRGRCCFRCRFFRTFLLSFSGLELALLFLEDVN
jgi:hypothetical protein